MDQESANLIARLAEGRAFAGDMFRREQHAGRLTAYLERLREGAVLAIDAPWGEGKTWFGRNWAASLELERHKVVFIDALEQDYVEEPFLLIAAEIADVLDDGRGSVRGLREKAATVMRAILPMEEGLLHHHAELQRLAPAWLPEPAPAAAGPGIAAAAASGEAEKWFERKLENHAKDSASFRDFRNELAALAAAEQKSLVLFVDELDRCQPAFALRLIERLKHFFDVPKLVFVLLVNRDQLHQAICRVYGFDTDADAYLNRFINFFFALPKRACGDHAGSVRAASQVEHAFRRYELDDSAGLAVFKACLTWTAAWFDLSMQEIERAVALYAFACPVNQHSYLLAYVIALRIARPDLFRRLRKGSDLDAHREALDTLKAIRAKTAFAQPCHYLALLLEWHEAHVNGFPASGEGFTLRLREYDRRSGEPPSWLGLHRRELWDAQRKLFQALAERIDAAD